MTTYLVTWPSSLLIFMCWMWGRGTEGTEGRAKADEKGVEM